MPMNDCSSRPPQQMRRKARRSLRLAAGALALGLAGMAGLVAADAQAASHPARARPAHGASVTRAPALSHLGKRDRREQGA